MAIQWFPGHMNSARRKAAETMAKTDVVIEVVDARAPEASSNPMIRSLRQHRNRPCLKVLNKADLADPAVTRQWLDHYNAQPGLRAIAISSKKAAESARIPSECRKLAPHRNDAIKPLRMMIMGIPNVGKSTLMNTLLGRRVAKVGDEPAVTKQQQVLDLAADMKLVDTPGLLWPKIVHASDGYMLAACHAVGVNAVLEEEVATHLAGWLLAGYAPGLAARYRIDADGLDGVALLEAVARKRNCFRRVRGGAQEIDMDKAAIVLLTDFRSGALGRISLESPVSRAAMLAAAPSVPESAAAGDGVDDDPDLAADAGN